MDISNATALASAIVALVAPALVQAFKKYIPADYVGLASLGSSIILGVIAVGATGGFNHATWAVALAAVVGVAQAVYVLVNQAFGGKLSKTQISD
ncbi:hypothetical protein [Bifidobacterium boum]|jgi:ammonia channel protein AmtB|uniref:Uncharacterized protein n=1 Tax=Bifidobacterium boum TaxID=78343 RepID=A0A086ZNY0_9BIFI|nr:hypothetical protein [Bifidobacterium boum]KFI48230.1 hypothetical protein BBOU_0360 [Bifidobacterium boum]